jgi:branched-chain amino acid transport system permease protein
MGAGADLTEGVPLVPDLLDPDRWLMWLGILFVLSVYFFPTGIVGRLRGRR